MNPNGLVTLTTSRTVDDVVERIMRLLAEKQVKLFAVIDHSGEAKAAGLSMPETKVVIFGSPKAGTPLMLASPFIAIDLPLRLLISAGPPGQTQVSYNDPEYLRQRHGFPEELLQNIQAASAIASAAIAD